MKRLLHVTNGLLLTALVGGSLFVYPDLPDRIPLDFGADGSVDRWGDRSLLSWMALPLIGLATGALLMGSGLLLPHRPALLNMPDKDRLLQLPPHLQRRVLDGVAAVIHATTFVTLAMFAAIQYGAYRTAMAGDGSSVIRTGVILGLVALPFVTIGLLVVMQKRMDAAWREHQAAAAPES